MIYGNRSYAFETVITESVASKDAGKALDKIYNEGKAEINSILKLSQAAFKANNYKEAKVQCNKIIKVCDNSIKSINKVDESVMGTFVKLKKGRYIKYFNFMSDDSKVAIAMADDKLKSGVKESADIDEVFGTSVNEHELFVETVQEYILTEAKDEFRAAIVKETTKALKNVFLANGFSRVQVGGFVIGGPCKDFLNGTGDTYLYALQCVQTTRKVKSTTTYDVTTTTTSERESVDITEEICAWITNNTDKLTKAIEQRAKIKVDDIYVEFGRLNVINLSVTYNFGKKKSK